MAPNNGSLYNYSCSRGLVLPMVNEFTWTVEARAFLYIFGLLYSFLGVAIIADVFMGAIEKITSSIRIVYRSRGEGLEPEQTEVQIWNGTVANLTLMALGSSAPEILLSIIEIIGNGFDAGELGPGTIVGSAAFNMLGITAACIASVPGTESRRIKDIKVFAVTAVFSIWAYLWLLVILVGNSKDEVEVWEGVVTFLFFPLLVGAAYLTDKGFTCSRKQTVSITVTDPEGKTQIELGSFDPKVDTPVDGSTLMLSDGTIDHNEVAKYVLQAMKMGVTEEEAAKLAAYKLITSQDHSQAWYRIGAMRTFTGGKRILPQLNTRLQEVYDAMNQQPTTNVEWELAADSSIIPNNVAVVEFHAITCAVPENVGKFPVAIVRRGRMDNVVGVRVETVDGCAVAGSDYVPVDQVVFFDANETEKQVMVEIIDDNQPEPDEQFYLKLSPLNSCKHGATVLSEMKIGPLSIMEVIILDDDNPGTVMFEDRGLLVKESAGKAKIPVIRKHGTDGTVSVRWRTLDRSAISGESYKGGEGVLVFQPTEMKRIIEIPIKNNLPPKHERDECFEVELFETTGGASLGPLVKTAITITNDHEFCSVLDRLAELAEAKMTSHRVHRQTWIDQIKGAMNVNGGDLETATTTDYVMHVLTFPWKLLFSLVPPAGMLGGWLTFLVSLAWIAVLTVIVGDMASIFGCLVGLQDTVTAITFVAMGTSLPDLFASRVATMTEKHADNAVGNITGSNSVNVFLGLGLPWMIASIYHAVKGTKFVVKAGSLGFSITCFTISAGLCLLLLVLRRSLSICGKGELGGPLAIRYVSAAFLFFLWLAYVLLSSLEIYGHIAGF